MVVMGWLYLAAASSLLSSSCLGAAVNGEDSVGVTMCCPEGRVLKLVPTNGPTAFEGVIAKCVRSKRAPMDTLDGGTITVTDDEGGQKEMVVKKAGLMLPSCPLGLKIQMISLNMSNSDDSYVNETSQPEVFKRVRLGDYECGHSNCQKGNVYVDDKPVCDDDWDDDDASVVCKELGFNDGGHATKESYFGSVDLENQSGLDQVRCSGREASLLDCRHETFDDCGNSEGAGVVCYGQTVGSGQCVVDSSRNRLLPHAQDVGRTNTADRCMEYCISENFPFMGVQATTWCHCGNTAPPTSSYAPASDCDHLCPGDNNQICGGAWRMNVFSTEPEADPEAEPEAEPEPANVILLTSSGQLAIPDEREGVSLTTYQTGEFCMAGILEVGGWEAGGGPSVEIGVDQAVALMCEPCKSEILCSNIQQMFTELSPRNPEIVAGERNPITNNIVLVGDKNGDASVNFEEFKAKIENYLEKMFNWLDLDGDGALDDGVSLKSLSAKLFLEALDETYLFVDVNQDDILSVEDAPKGSFRDRNDDGKISLREVFGVSLINLPAPLYRLYATLDKDKNEKISFEEARSFIKGTLYALDKNEDCSINMDEIIATLEESKLPAEYQLAMKLLGDYYFTLVDYFLQQFVTAADVDGDKKTTLAEIIGLKDPAVLSSIYNFAMNMGEPHKGTSQFLVGEGKGSSHSQAVRGMWLYVLYDFVDNKKYGSVPNNFCGLE